MCNLVHIKINKLFKTGIHYSLEVELGYGGLKKLSNKATYCDDSSMIVLVENIVIFYKIMYWCNSLFQITDRLRITNINEEDVLEYNGGKKES